MAQRLTLHKADETPDQVLNGSFFSALTGFDLLNILWSRRKLIGITCGAVTVLAAITLFLIPNKYASTATILPSSAGDKFADLKALAGIGGSVSNDGSSSELFPTILYSRSIQEAVLERSYATEDGNVMLSDYFDQTNPDKLRKALVGITSVDTDRKTGVIWLAVETDEPRLAQGIATAYLEELEKYNMFTRRSKGRQNVDYLQRQLTDQTAQLTLAENNLAAFQAENRDWAATTSPEILKGLTRLQREVEVKSAAVLFLNQQYEIAKFDAQKDIPIVQVLDTPSLPTVKSSPKRLIWIALAALLSLFATSTLVLLATVLRGLETGKKVIVSQTDTITLPEPVSRIARILAQEEVGQGR